MMVGGDVQEGGRGWRGAVLRVASGFLYGLGFAIALAGVVVLTAIIGKRIGGKGVGGEQSSGVWHKRFTSGAGLTIESHRARRTRYNLIIVGSVLNGGKDGWESVEPEVHLLDGKGNVVGICGGYVHGALRPGQRRYFSVDCDGSEGEPVPKYTKYTVEIVSAHYEMEDDT